MSIRPVDPIVSRRTYLLVDLALLLLTVTTIGLAQVNLHGWNSAVAMAIAVLKALLIATFFMHLRWSPPLVRFVSIAALIWLGLLVVGTMDDILTRGWLAAPGR